MLKIGSAGLLAIALLAGAAGPARAGDGHRAKARPDRPNTLEQVARSLDGLEEKILDDGTVVLKQPDVYSQSRMTLYRKNFEQQIFKAIDQFNVVLSARVFRSDQAAFLSQGNLAAAAGPASTTTTTRRRGVAQQTVVTNPPTLISPGAGPGITPNGLAPTSISRPDALTALGPGPFAQGFAQPNSSYGLGVEPTVYLDQLKRYQDHLNEIRRVNMGDDIADSAGYGLHLIRMPVSIQPGECTRKGFGAVLTVTARHGFGSNFLYQTYRNLAINDLVDQLAPVVFEMIRSDAPKELAGLADSTDLFRKYQYARQSPARQFEAYRFATAEDIRRANEQERDGAALGAIGPGAGPDAPRPESDATRRKDPRSRANALGALEITRVNERDYPIPPSEVGNVFFAQNLYALALAAREGMQTVAPKASDVRVFLRRELETAYDIITQLYADADPDRPAIIDQFERSVEEIAGHVRNLEYGRLEDDYRDLARVLPGKFRYTDGPRAIEPREVEILGGLAIDVAALERQNPHYFRDVDPQFSLVQELTILTYAIAVEAGLLNNQLRLDMKRVFAKGGRDCSAVDAARFFAARPTPEAEEMFQEYVKQRWRIITFALDPVVEEQNIADAGSVRRDLQLAFAFAFSTGQINFQQLNQFQRRIEVDAEAIALNRTVTSFAHGNDTFGFRFLPRYQGPPPQRTNLQVIGSQLIGNGGSGPNYRLKNSQLEAGQRELSAVVIMPSFLQGVEMDVTGNWFPLHDPDQMKVPTPRMIEQGRQVVELQEALACIHDHARYRPGDFQRLTSRVHQVESMLPMQTYDVAVPFENTLGGFQLFQQGITALVPQLDSFEGAAGIHADRATELVLFGKHFSIQETNVIAGGAYLADYNLDSGNLAPAPAPVPAPSPPLLAVPALPLPTGPSAATVTETVPAAASPVTTVPKLPTTPTTTVNNAAIDIVSREVMRITIPAGVSPTLVYDADKNQKKVYVEVYVATPTGISNRLLIPYLDAADDPDRGRRRDAVEGAFDLAGKDASVLDVAYQWLEGREGKPELVATRDPGPVDQSGLRIAWDSPVSLAPKALLVTFTAMAGDQMISLALPANLGTRDDYAVDRQQLTLMLLERLQVACPYPRLLPANLAMTVSVQPWIPREGMGTRVRTAPKPLKTPLRVNLTPLITNVDALEGVPIAPPPGADDRSASAKLPRPAPKVDPSAQARIRAEIDGALRRASAPIPAPKRPQAPAAPTLRTPAPPRPTARPAEPAATRDPMARRTSAEGPDILILPPLPPDPRPAADPSKASRWSSRWADWKPPWRRGDR